MLSSEERKNLYNQLLNEQDEKTFLRLLNSISGTQMAVILDEFGWVGLPEKYNKIRKNNLEFIHELIREKEKENHNG